MMDAQLLEMLNKVKTGEITVAEGLERLEVLDDAPQLATAQVISNPPPQDEAPPEDARLDIGWWKNAWLVPFGVGTLILVLSALVMGWAYPNNHFFWFYCSWLPLVFGLLVLMLGAWSRGARWAHVRVQDNDGTRVSVSVPLPMKLAGWALRVFGPRIEALRKNNMDQLWMIFEAMEKSRDPIWVDVNDEDGSKVKVYIL